MCVGQGGRVGGEVLAGTWLISPEKYCRKILGMNSDDDGKGKGHDGDGGGW